MEVGLILRMTGVGLARPLVRWGVPLLAKWLYPDAQVRRDLRIRWRRGLPPPFSLMSISGIPQLTIALEIESVSFYTNILVSRAVVSIGGVIEIELVHDETVPRGQIKPIHKMSAITAEQGTYLKGNKLHDLKVTTTLVVGRRRLTKEEQLSGEIDVTP